MRIWTVDQYEFENPHAEEMLEVVFASRGDFQFSNIVRFVEAAAGEQAAKNLRAALPFDERLGGGTVRKYLDRFTGLQLPLGCEWPTHILRDEWNECHLILCGPEQFISYRWTTSA